MVEYPSPNYYAAASPLHVTSRVERQFRCRRESRSSQPLQGLTILDVGCGGGLFSEALARLGASVTGIDASKAGIFVAREHARADPLIHERTTYRNITAEQAVEEGQHNLAHSSFFVPVILPSVLHWPCNAGRCC